MGALEIIKIQINLQHEKITAKLQVFFSFFETQNKYDDNNWQLEYYKHN